MNLIEKDVMELGTVSRDTLGCHGEWMEDWRPQISTDLCAIKNSYN